MKNKIRPEDFIKSNEVQACLQELKTAFGDHFEKLLVSDVMDQSGNQYVNLVQKGGGVLGVALVGYTYILEQAGIRFIRLAGTSAGAINTAFLAVIGKKEETKSERILQYLCDLDFFQLVDGHPFGRWVIKKFITQKKFENQMISYLRILIISLLGLFLFDTTLLGLGHYFSWAQSLGIILFYASAILLVFLIFLLFYGYYLFHRLKKSGYGINPGEFFYDWIKDRMKDNGILTVTDLNRRVEELPELKVRKPMTQNVNTLFGDVTFICSELVSENKIEFPRMCRLFRENVDDLHPAGFVRASMSIPVFFESFLIDQIPITPAIKAAWAEFFDPQMPVPSSARFVDGGILSNFPINIFYNPRIIETRAPCFGIDLDDSDPKQEPQENVESWSLDNYLGRIFNTIRSYYDKDFLLKNKVFRKGIGTIRLSEFNWLNFFLTDEDKLKMFIKGARAATDFLKTFDWPEYQRERIRMQTFINEKQRPEQTKAEIAIR
jgi:NTE family protein